MRTSRTRTWRPFFPESPSPRSRRPETDGFEADPGSGRIRAVGRLHALAGRLGVLAPPLDALGTVPLDSEFDLTRDGASIRVDRSTVRLGEPVR